MRTEDQIIAQDPIKAKLGGTEYEIPLLKLNKSRLWKQEWYDAVFKSDKWKETVGKVEAAQKGASQSELQDALSMGFHSLLIDQPETVITLVISYLNYANVDIKKEWVDENATEAEIALLWEQINDVSFPLVTSLANAMSRKR
jgi:hypothetical protein